MQHLAVIGVCECMNVCVCLYSLAVETEEIIQLIQFMFFFPNTIYNYNFNSIFIPNGVSESFLISFKVGFFICLTLTKRCD